MKLVHTNVKVMLRDGSARDPASENKYKPASGTPIPGVVKKGKGTAVKTPKVGQKVTLKPSKPGQKKITFKKGALHAALGVPQGKKIPAGKMAAARAGKYGAKASKEASFAKNVLTGKK